MTQQDWDSLSEDDLKKLLVARWLYRSGMLAAALALLVLLMMVAMNGLGSLMQQILAGVLAVFTAASVGVFVYLRLHDRRIVAILRDRRRPPSE